MACRSDWINCKDNSDLVNNYLHDYRAQVDCKNSAQKLAKYGKAKLPWLYPFSTFLVGNDYPKTGIVTLIEKEAQYQNEHGAMAHAEVTCTYDLRAKRVISVTR